MQKQTGFALKCFLEAREQHSFLLKTTGKVKKTTGKVKKKTPNFSFLYEFLNVFFFSYSSYNFFQFSILRLPSEDIQHIKVTKLMLKLTKF